MIHAAARPNPHYPGTFENNTRSTWNLALAARDAGVERFIFLSSVCANGRSGLPLTTESLIWGLARTGRMAIYCLRPCVLWKPEATLEYRPGARPPRKGANLVDPWHYLDLRDLAVAVQLYLQADHPSFGRAYLTAADTTRPEPSLLLLAYYFPRLFWRIRGNLWGHRSHRLLASLP